MCLITNESPICVNEWIHKVYTQIAEECSMITFVVSIKNEFDLNHFIVEEEN